MEDLTVLQELQTGKYPVMAYGRVIRGHPDFTDEAEVVVCPTVELSRALTKLINREYLDKEFDW